MYIEPNRLKTPAGVSLPSPETIQVGEIGAQAQLLSSRIDKLFDTIAIVTDSLQAVLAPEGTAPPSAFESKQQTTPMGDYLSTQNDRLGIAIDQLQALNSRVEL